MIFFLLPTKYILTARLLVYGTPIVPIGHAARSCAAWPRRARLTACCVLRLGVETLPKCSLGIRSARPRIRVRTSLLPRPL